jgi:hypothetical protein
MTFLEQPSILHTGLMSKQIMSEKKLKEQFLLKQTHLLFDSTPKSFLSSSLSLHLWPLAMKPPLKEQLPTN